MNTTETLHNRFNRHNDHVPPVRVKGFQRVHLDRLFGELGLLRGVEVGTSQGLHALQLCREAPGLKLSCVDPYEKYHWKHNIEEHERCFELAHERLDPFGVEIIRERSMEAARHFADGSLDFVYIDGNHEFDYVMEDLIHWSRKVRRGGIVSGHDAYRFRGAGVVDAVSVYTFCHQIHEWFVCDEREVSFFWAKP